MTLDAHYQAIVSVLEERKRSLLLSTLDSLHSGELDMILTHVSQITQNRYDTLRRIESYTEAAKEPESYSVVTVNKGGKQKQQRVYHPPVVTKQVIKVNFSGLGSELKGEHYAVVWVAKSNREQLTVIPTYSFKNTTVEKPHLFNIGMIPNLSAVTGGNETLVSVDQVTTISRKRIKEVEFAGRKAFVSNEQMKRIKEGFRAYWIGETTLYSVIDGFYETYLPEITDLQEQISHLHRPIRERQWDVDKENSTLKGLKYSFYDEFDSSGQPVWHYLAFKPMKTFNKKRRKEILYNLINCIYSDRPSIHQKLIQEIN